MIYLNIKYGLFIFIIVYLTIISCKNDVSNFIPEFLDDKRQSLLLNNDNKLSNYIQAIANGETLFQGLHPTEFSYAKYKYFGIKIFFVVAKFKNMDEAFGVSSRLTLQPTGTWQKHGGKMYYKSPFFSGHKGKYAFWFHSTSHPQNIFGFYQKRGMEIFKKIGNISTKDNGHYYHKFILPRENLYRGSITYSSYVDFDLFILENLYHGRYLIINNNVQIYVSLDKNQDTQNILHKFEDIKNSLSKYNIPFKKLSPGLISDSRAIYWPNGKKAFNVLNIYKWILIMFDNISDATLANSFIKVMFKNMTKMRTPVLKYKKNNLIYRVSN